MQTTPNHQQKPKQQTKKEQLSNPVLSLEQLAKLKVIKQPSLEQLEQQNKVWKDFLSKI